MHTRPHSTLSRRPRDYPARAAPELAHAPGGSPDTSSGNILLRPPSARRREPAVEREQRDGAEGLMAYCQSRCLPDDQGGPVCGLDDGDVAAGLPTTVRAPQVSSGPATAANGS